jgi:hypothetical protein
MDAEHGRRPLAQAIGKSLDDIMALYQSRRSAQGEKIERMRVLRDTYNGELVIPLPEMDRNEQASTANIIAVGLDQFAMRVASTQPSVDYPPLEYGNNASMKRARTRTRANMGWWETNKMPLKLRQRARHLSGYASSPVILKPDLKKGCARWYIRDPLSAYPSNPEDSSDMTPSDVVFAYDQTRGWVKQNFPDKYPLLTANSASSLNDRLELIEYNDDEVIVLAVIGKKSTDPWTPDRGGSQYVELSRTPNRTGLCLAVTPGRISLDKPQGQFDGLVGAYVTQAKLMALELIAVERGVFPDAYLISRPGETARFITGPFDGRTGKVNIISGGDFKEAAANPGFASNGMLDRLERSMRIGGGVPAEFGGESTTNVRTGRRGDAILSAVVDFTVQESQEILAESLVEENKRAVAIAKAYFGNEKRSFYVSNRKSPGHVDYTPNKDFETDNNIVTFPHAGVDANGLATEIGQRIGLGTISKRSAMEIDPMVGDPELEHDRIIAEGLEQSMLQSIEQQAASGAIPPADVARIASLVGTDKKTLAEAITLVHTETQQRQATPAPQGAPETMPGLAQPGAGAEQPPIAGPTGNQSNLKDLMNALRAGGRAA